VTTPRRIGLLGGTFDPVHIAHLHIAACAMHDLHLDEVRFVPAGSPPHKPNQPVTPAHHRLQMLEMATEGVAGFRVDPVDLGEQEPSYTSDLLARIRELHPDEGLWFIIGGDSLRDFPSWHEPDRILQLARLAVAERPGVDTGEALRDPAMPVLATRTDLFSSVPVNLSSTVIRERLALGQPVDWLVPPAVLAYIQAHGLYR
jgi:nicotinate-nucleotide adenylyltransferase